MWRSLEVIVNQEFAELFKFDDTVSVLVEFAEERLQIFALNTHL
jgi:hypothetical protein